MRTTFGERPPPMLYALQCAERGWPVFPLQYARKTPHSGSRGLSEATTDIGAVERLWASYGKHSGVGVRCVGAAGFRVDLDNKPGRDGLQFLTSELPVTLNVRTPSGGVHLIYATPPGIQIRTGADIFGPGIDLRGPGGYRVAWLSNEQGGNAYAADEMPIAEAPGWLLADDRLYSPQNAMGGGTDVTAFADGDSCPAVEDAGQRWLDDGDNREHDATARRIEHLVRLGVEGHTGVSQALAAMRALYIDGRQEKTAMDGTAREDGGSDFDRMLNGALTKAPAVSGRRDPCGWAAKQPWKPRSER